MTVATIASPFESSFFLLRSTEAPGQRFGECPIFVRVSRWYPRGTLKKSSGQHPRPRVLVVDDDDICREVLASVLEVEGYVVTTASNGLDAIKAIDLMPEPPDAIVLDLMMPVMN